MVAADAMMSGGDRQPETLVGVTVTLGGEHAMGETMETDETGGFAFTGLRAGSYTVTISDYPEDVAFETLSIEVEVPIGEVGNANFTGHYIRTSAVEGRVVIDGEGLAGVTVSLAGGPADESYTTATDADGGYRFGDLRPGSYTVSISDFDTRDYEFAATSQDVSVDLDETGTVSFTGVLLRTSGIAGRVSAEGMGLGGIEVSLAGGDESRTATTDGEGQYNFAGLAAGDYTVSIAVASDAYVFDSMSADVTLGDDESAIVNFEGAHARTASVSGMAFLDEATKNDMHDEGEDALAHAGIPVALVGPGVNEQRLGATDASGAFSFTGLVAGAYQLVVLIDADAAAALAAADVAYGGSATGYSINLGVGEAASQAVPFDITHTTVNFAVSLRHGDDMGDAVPGAMVTLYADAAGESKVGSGETGDGGSVAIKVARAGTSGNTVHAGVAADGYDVAPGMTAVTWDPQMFAASGANANDIVNLNVDASVGGATITTDFGGGDALAGWAIGVTHGDDAVAGAPAMLDDDGMASLKTTVGAGDLPATFTFAAAADQADALDGGENYDATSVEYTHDGLSLAGTMAAGTIEVQYTTQTLKVYVHHEKDQVMGYTGNILGGDVRDSAGNISVGIRYIDGSGRSRAFASADKVESSGNKSGVHTFGNVPADANVIVQADEAMAGVKLLDPDELAAYMGVEDNGITGGAFGANGGYSHTVELCPLQAVDPTGQDHGECASFAYVTTHTVSGSVSKMAVKTDGDDFGTPAAVAVPGVTVSLNPVAGENLAGEAESSTTAEKDNDGTDINEAKEFAFAGVAAGVYKFGVPAGWASSAGSGDFDPLAGDVTGITVTPKTATVYGNVVDDKGFVLEGASVDANGMSAMTDQYGRYIIDGISAVANDDGDDVINVVASKDGQKKTVELDWGTADVGPNKVYRVGNLMVSAAGATASISGTVRASGTNAPVAGVSITVTGSKVTNLDDGKLLTGTDGTYTAIVEAKKLGESVTLSASKDGMTFVPEALSAPAHADAEISGIDFTGFVNATISGKVAAPLGGPMAGAVVSATSTTTSMEYADTTSVTGTFSISVPFGGYTLMASAMDHTFEIDAAYQTINVAPGQTVDVGTIQARTFGVSGVMAMRVVDTDTKTGRKTYSGDVKVTWTKGTQPENHTVTYQAQTKEGENWADLGNSVAHSAADSLHLATGSVPGDGAFMVRVLSISTDASNVADTIASDAMSVPAVDPMASGVTAGRDTANADSITVTWDATTNDDSNFRIVVQFSDGVWYVAGNQGTMLDNNSREWVLNAASDLKAADAWTSVDGTGTKQAQAELAKAFNVSVQWVQGTVTDDNPWMGTDPVAVAAKPAG